MCFSRKSHFQPKKFTFVIPAINSRNIFKVTHPLVCSSKTSGKTNANGRVCAGCPGCQSATLLPAQSSSMILCKCTTAQGALSTILTTLSGTVIVNSTVPQRLALRVQSSVTDIVVYRPSDSLLLVKESFLLLREPHRVTLLPWPCMPWL